MNTINLKPIWGLLCLFLFYLPFVSAQTIYGTVTNEYDVGLEGVKVSLSCLSGYTDTTDASGAFIFENIPAGDLCSIWPFVEGSVFNGVSTFDLVLMSKHILGVQLLDSPYKMIAADVNNSGTITQADLIAIMEVIYGIEDEFPNYTSWRFLPGSFIFPDPTNPWATDLPEVINIGPVTGENEVNFIAIKIADVNGSATPD